VGSVTILEGSIRLLGLFLKHQGIRKYGVVSKTCVYIFSTVWLKIVSFKHLVNYRREASIKGYKLCPILGAFTKLRKSDY
jgi:hypothetical protein